MATPAERCQVEAYSGTRYGEEPRAFTCSDARFEVEEVCRRWRAPGELHFLVVTRDSQRAELIYREPDDLWWVVFKD